MKAAIVYNADSAFLLTEKCASNSLFNVLIDRLQWRSLPRASMTLIRRHSAGEQVSPFGLGSLGLDGLERRTTYAVHRNPYSRMVSTWWDVTHNARFANGHLLAAAGSERFLPFCRYVAQMDRRSEPGRRSIYQPQTYWLRGLRVDRWLAFEGLADEWRRLPFTDDAELPRLNRTDGDRRHWSDYYCAESMDIVAEWAAEDFDAFGYDLNIDIAEAVVT